MSNGLGYWYGYLRKPCPNCGRMRVERWRNKEGTVRRVCEKCKWCLETGGYYRDGDEDDAMSSGVRLSEAD